ncbi:NYN domain-containing protein [Pallidibacillus pasinlerensis]|uniref:NYN domain-containing protein n=1 Tax=Pallidibacillus pasinlerensis TaxID=2703818 RepID=A0ABX0A2B4_9BACI|nr:NYN domain-containing protein [Pallidibacillus pasinlerensis]NCU17570.1 NYN domain-containing protein [Pallidibacillus pasinlerensis]
MDILIVDGYNMIGAWPELQALKDKDLAAARDLLIEKLAEYKGYMGIHVIVVFDAYVVKGKETKYKNYNVEIIYTKEKETADARIEKLAREKMNRKTKVYVATSDGAEQWQIFGQGAFRVSARELYNDIRQIEVSIEKELKEIEEERPFSKIPLSKEVADFFEKFRRGE